MTHDYKADCERLEKMLDSAKGAPLTFMVDQVALVNERKGVNDFLKLLVSRKDNRAFISFAEIADIFEEYAGIVRKA